MVLRAKPDTLDAMRRQFAFEVCLLLTVRVVVLRAATIAWIADGTAVSNWNDAGKWSLGRVPEAADDVVIADPGNYTIVVSSENVAVASLRVVDGAENFGIALQIRRRFTVAGPCTIGGQLQIPYNGELRFQSDVAIAGDVELGGRLTGIGSKRTIIVPRAVVMRTAFSNPILSNSELTVSAQLSVLPSTRYGETNVQLEHGASIVVSTGATATMTSASTVTGSDGAFVRNEGTFECRDSSGNGCYVAAHLINDGNVDVVSRSRLRLASSTNVGEIYVDRHSRLTLMSGTHAYFPEAVIRIDGTLETASGSSSVAARSFSIARVLSNGGVVSFNFSTSGTVETINSIEVTGGTVKLENTDSGASSLSTDVLSINGNGVISMSVNVETKSLLMSSPSRWNYGEMEVSSSVVVTDRWVWDAGTVSGPGTIRVSGSVDISQSDAGVTSVYLYVSTAVVNNAAVFRKPSSLVLGANTRFTISQSSVVTFAAVGCKITGATGHSVINNWGLVQTATHYTGKTVVSVSEFNNYGRVAVESEVASTLELRGSVSSEGSFEIASENTLTLDGTSARGNRMSRIVGNGTLDTSASQAQLYNVLVPRLEVHGGSVHVASSDSNLLTLTELTVLSGVCTLDSDLSVIVQLVKVLGGTLSVDGTATVESLQMTSGTLKAETMTIQKEFSWTGGTVSGRQITADTLHVYFKDRKSLTNVHLVVRNLARVQEYGMSVVFTNAAILEVALGAKANVIGDVTFSTSDLSSAFIGRGDINVMAENFIIVPSVHVYRSMTLLNSNLFLKGASTLDGDIVVGLNSSLSLQASLVMSESSRMSGNGELRLSYSSSAIQLFNINMETIRVTTGSPTIRTNGNLTLIDVSGGTLEIADNDETEPVFIHRVTVSGTSSFVSQRSVHVEELTVSGSGQFTAANGGIITDHFQWISGWIKGNVFGQTRLEVAGRLRIVSASTKYMQYANLVIANEGTWRGFGNIAQYDGSSITVSSGAHFSVDTTSSVTQSGGLSSIINKGNLTIESSRVLSVHGVLENYGNFAVQDSGSLRLLGHSRFHSGSLSLEDNSILRIASSSSNRHAISSDCTVFSSNTSTLDLNSGFLTIDVLTLRGNLRFNSHIVIHSIEENLVTESLLLSGQSRLILRSQKNPLRMRQVTVSSASRLQVDAPLIVQNLTIIDGTISGAGDITARKVLWKDGTISGSTISRLDVSDSFDLVDANNKDLISRQLHISGVSQWSGSGSLLLSHGAKMTINPEAKIFVESDMGISTSSGASATNYGYIEHSPLFQLPGYLTLNAEMDNLGTLKALGAGGLILKNSIVSLGVVEVANSNSSLKIISGSHVFKKTAILRGSGAVEVQSGQLNIESGDIKISSLRVTSGTVVLSPPPISVIYLRELRLSSSSSVVSSSSTSTMIIDALLLTSGTANFGGKTNITYANVTKGILSTATEGGVIIDDGVWYGGKVSGQGEVVVRSFVALKASNAFVVESGTTVVASSDAHIGGSIQLGSNARFVISQNATAVLADQGVLAEQQDGTSLFVNYGTIKIAKTFSLQTPLRNEGLVVVEAGTVTTDDVTMTTGRIEVPYGAELKLTGNFRTFPDSVISGRGRLSISGTATVSSRAFDISHVVVSGGTLNVDLSRSTLLATIEMFDGLLVVPLHSDILRVKQLKIYGGKIESHAPVIVSDQLYMVSGEFAARDRVDVLGEFLYYGGTVSGGDVDDRFPFSVENINVASNFNPSGSYVVSGKRIVVKKRGDWIGKVGSKLELSGPSILEIASEAVFNVSQSVDSSIEGNGKIVNRGKMFISTIAASPLNLLKISSLNNFGQLFISNDSKASVTGNFLCPMNGSVNVAREAELRIAGLAYLSCLVTGAEGALSVTGGGTLDIDESGSNMFDVKALSIQSQSTVKIKGNFSCEELTISDGTLQGGKGTERIGVTIKNELSMFGGSVVKVSVSSMGKTNLEKSLTMRSSSLSLYGNSAIEGIYQNTAVLLADGSTLKVHQAANLTLRHYVSFSQDSSSSSIIINDGIIESVGLSTKAVLNLPILNNGQIRAKARMSLLTFQRVDVQSKGTFYIAGKESQLQITGNSRSQISAEEFCDTCELYVANGEVELNTNNTSRRSILANVRINGASLSLFSQNNVTITSLLLEQSSSVRLQPTLHILRLTVDGSSSVVRGSSPHVDTLVFRSGTFGSASDQYSSVAVMNLEIPTDSSKQLVNCEMTVLNTATFHFGSLDVKAQSRLIIASSATVTFQSTYVRINGGNPASASDGELVNNGRMRIEMVPWKIAVMNIYFSNSGTVELKTGDLELRGSSDHRGTLIVDYGSSLMYTGNRHSSTAESTIYVQGTVAVKTTATVLWSYTSANLNALLIQSGGTVNIRSSACIERVNVSGGILKVDAASAIGVLDLSDGTLECSETVAVNGFARWTGGALAFSGLGELNFNGDTEIASGLADSKLTIADGICSYANCVNCLDDSKCVWFSDGGTCIAKTSYDKNPGKSCQTWALSAAQCSSAAAICNAFQVEKSCNNQSTCHWCASADSCLKATDACPGKGVYWRSRGDGLWADEQSWSEGRVPSVSSHVFINIPRHLVVQTSYTVTVKSLTVGGISKENQQPKLSIRHGVTTVNLTVFQGAVVTVHNSLTWTGEAVIYGTILWAGSSLIGSGPLNVYGSFVLEGSAVKTLNAEVRLHGKAYHSQGTVNFSSKKIFHVLSNASLSSYAKNHFGQAGSQIVNEGTIRIASRALSLSIAPQLNHTGLIIVERDTNLQLTSAVVNGTVEVRTGGFLTTRKAVFGSNANVSGIGGLSFTSTVAVERGAQLDVPEIKNSATLTLATSTTFKKFTLSGGLVSVRGSVNVTDLMHWINGDISSAANTSRWNALGPVLLRPSRYTWLEKKHLLSIDFVSYSGSTIEAGSNNLYATIRTTGASRFILTSGSYFDVASVSRFEIDVPLVNEGLLAFSGGDAFLDGGVTNRKDCLIRSTSKLFLRGVSNVFESTSRLTAHGTLLIDQSSSKVVISGALTVPINSISISRGQLTLSTSGQVKSLTASNCAITTHRNIRFDYLSVGYYATMTTVGKLSASFVRVYSWRSAIRLSNQTHDVDILFFGNRGCEVQEISGKPTLRVNEYFYVDHASVSSVEIVLGNEMFLHGTNAKYFVNGAKLVVPKAAQVAVTTISKPFLTGSGGQIVNSGTLAFQTLKESLTSSTGHVVDIHFINNGNCSFHGRAWITKGSEFTGNIEVLDGSRLDLSGKHTWRGKIWSDTNSVISLLSSSRSAANSLEIAGNQAALISQLEIQTYASVDLDVSPSLLSLAAVYLERYGTLQCFQNCTIEKSLVWTSGTLLMASVNTTITLPKNSTLQAVGGSQHRYTGSGSVIVQGAAAFDTGYSLYIGGRFVVEGNIDVYSLPGIYTWGGSGAVINRGRITVHHGYTVQVNTLFENLNELNVGGVFRLYGSGFGWSTGSIRIPLASGKFISAVDRSFEFANMSTISGRGTVQVERGTLAIFAVLSTSRGFSGTVRVSGGTLRISSTYLNLTRVEVIGSSSSQIFLTVDHDSHIDNVVHTSGTLTATPARRLLTIGVLELSGRYATMTGDSDVRVTTFVWGTSARVAGKRAITVVDHLLVHGSSHSLDGTHLIVANLAFFGGSSDFDLYSDAMIEIASHANASVLTSRTFDGRSGTKILVDGELRCGGELAVVVLNVELTNNGRLRVEKGTLKLSDTNVHHGTFDAAPGTIVEFHGTTTFTPTSNVSLAESSVISTATVNLETETHEPTFNSLSVSSGTFRVNTPMGLLIRTEMKMTSGTAEFKSRLRTPRLYMDRSNAIQTSDEGFVDVDELHWLSGTIKGRGKASPWFIVRRLARLTSTSSRTIEDGTIVFKERATLTETFNYLTLRRATLVNDGIFVLDSAATTVYSTSGRFVNNGAFVVDVGGGKASFYPEFNNKDGWIAVKSGRLQLLHSSSHGSGGGLELEPETSVQLSGSDHTFDDGAVIRCDVDSTVYVTSGRLGIYANSSNVTFSRLDVSGGEVIVHDAVTLHPFPYLRVARGLVRFNASTRIQKATLAGGTVVVPQRFQIDQLLMSSTSTIKGGRPKSRALLTVGQFIFSRGTIDAETPTPGRYFFVNVTDALTVASLSAACIVRRADLISYTQAVISSSSSSLGLYLERDARLVNSRHSTTILTIGRIGGTSTLLNYGRLVVETSGSLEVFNLDSQLVNTGGQVSVDVGQFRLNRGGLCNGTGGRVYVAEGTQLLVGGNTFQCPPEIIIGQGSMEIVSGGVLQLMSASPIVLPLTMSTGGRITVPRNVVGATFVAMVTIDGGTMQVDGMANVTSHMSLISGSITGSGIVVIAETGRMTTEFNSISQSFSIANQVQNFGDFLLKESVDVSTNGRLRNEKTGRVTIVGKGRIVGAGIVENLGLLNCRLHENATCQVATNFRNYKSLQIESGQMDLTSSPWLVDGSTLDGPGRLGTVSNLRVGGRMNVDWTITSNVAIDGPLFSARTCTWTTGVLSSSSSSGACTAYSPQSSPVLTPHECKEDFFVNEGLLVVAGSGAKQINSDATLINRGVVDWKAGSLTVAGSLIVDANSSMTAVSDDFNTALQLLGSGHVTNKGLLSVAKSIVSISVDLQNTGTISLDDATLTISKTMTNRGRFVGFGAISGIFVNAGTLQSSGARPLALGSGSSFSQSSAGTLTVTVIESDGRFVSSLLDCTQATSVLLAGTVHVVWNATDALLPGEEGPPILNFGSGAAAGTFDAVTVNGGGGMVLTLAYKSTSVVLKRN